jgi:hypothetical protein
MRDDALECGVCHQPRLMVQASGAVAQVDQMRIGNGRSSGVPVAIVVLLALLVMLAVGAGAVTQLW